jgi:hypothetical protein
LRNNKASRDFTLNRLRDYEYCGDLKSFKSKKFGGERGIRTLDTLARMPPFQGGDLNHSSISPNWVRHYSAKAQNFSGDLTVLFALDVE